MNELKEKWDKFLSPDRIKKSKRTVGLDPRNEFESDTGRITFSPAIRRMHDKTQVFPLTTDDNIHSRLTHSLEVSEIGFSLGLRLCTNTDFLEKIGKTEYEAFRSIPVILRNSCLVHDIGNPPFGHFGERVIATFFKNLFKDKKWESELNEEERKDFIHFDGNSQGLRVLTKLQTLNEKAGLNLTFGTLGAFLKYPNFGDPDESKISTSKRGVFQSEIDYFKRIAENCGLEKDGIYFRHPLSFIMEAADTICYRIMDVEDGFNKDWFSYPKIKEYLEDVPGLEMLLESIDEIDGEGAEITKMVRLRIGVIANLVEASLKEFLDNLDSISNGDYHKELLSDNLLSIKLKAICDELIFPKREILQLEVTGHSAISGLLNHYIDFVFNKDKHYRKRAKGMISGGVIRSMKIDTSIDDFDKFSTYSKMQIIVDFISGMTDQFALDQYQRISGQKI
ncbi:dGTPase [Algoriphagus boseongensis]|uniref:dGTPase n=2 Tax=Algoriphagus boseongensis TaxID=1442587 RepID=A0A4R6T7U7_9BACT|nr:dGTPase [Algoriphagus boseongensis]